MSSDSKPIYETEHVTLPQPKIVDRKPEYKPTRERNAKYDFPIHDMKVGQCLVYENVSAEILEQATAGARSLTSYHQRKKECDKRWTVMSIADGFIIERIK